MVALNRAVAVATGDDPLAGLALVEQIEHGGELAGYHLPVATAPTCCSGSVRLEEAAIAYREALDFAPTDVERRYLRKRAAEVAAAT